METRREVVGHWTGMRYPTSPPRPETQLDLAADGTYRQDSERGTWHLEDRTVRLQPNGAAPWTLQLTDDGRLTDLVVDALVLVKVPERQKPGGADEKGP